MAAAMTKCQGYSTAGTATKTLELLEYLRLNDRMLRFKKKTVKNIEEATHNRKAHHETTGVKYI